MHIWFMAPKRDRRLSMLISDDEHSMMQALAELEGVSVSDYIRMFVRRQHAEKFGAQQVAAASKRSTKSKRR